MRLWDPINEESLRHQTTQLTVKVQPHRTHYDVLRNTNHIVVFTATFYSFSTGCQLRIVRIFKICLSTNSFIHSFILRDSAYYGKIQIELHTNQFK